ncbi:WAT1-related protein At5g64700 isoform X1 [Vitis vinifera]|uniref:WAT1-related protein At5g64700 isoform X1 n=1 Tax=Vitis vinifera TaxID=29760 RepID=UPI002883499A|nr:WAT1-related protein At5g64700 isoform X1 [Vitis vinifera]
MYLHSRTQRPSLSFSVMMKIFVLASLGTTIFLNVYYAGLHYTSATVASALSNGIPSLTFLMAVLFRMEEVRIQSARGRAKVLGTMVCIGGALTFTFWKGGCLFNGFTERPLINVYSTKGSASEHHGMKNWIKGSVLILISHIAWSSWLILQVISTSLKIISLYHYICYLYLIHRKELGTWTLFSQAVVYKVYPARLSLNGLICFFASLQSSFLALIFARNPVLWKLEWNVQLLTIIYCGVVGSGLVYYLQTWCISKRGPVFAAMFTPLLVSFVGIFSAVVAFAERLHLSSLIGAFLIIAGLYIVLSGKRIDGRSEGISKE